MKKDSQQAKERLRTLGPAYNATISSSDKLSSHLMSLHAFLQLRNVLLQELKRESLECLANLQVEEEILIRELRTRSK
jgi:hypothetical protein